MLRSLTFFLLAPFAPAQEVGGGWDLLFDHQAPMPGEFGEGLANAGDVNGDGYLDQIISAPSASPNGLPTSGAVFVYSGLDGNILQQVFGSSVSLHLGQSVAGLGDVDGDGLSDIAIGTSYAQPAGAVWVYSSMTNAPLYQLLGDPLNSSFGFGRQIAIVGDVDGDGTNDLLVNDPRLKNAAGGAYLYSGATGTLIRAHQGLNASDAFSDSISPAGDVDADGTPDYIIGAKFGSHGGATFGYACVYSGATGSVLHHFTSGPFTSYLGSAVAAAGDMDGDGYGDLLVAAEGAIDANQRRGSVIVFSGADGSIIHQVWGSTNVERFGMSVVNTGDVDRDGFLDFLVGAPGWNNDIGKVFLYSGANGEQITDFRGNGTSRSFGVSLAPGLDINQDSYLDTLIGAEGNLAVPGSVEIWGPADFMTSSENELSASAGGTIHFTIDFPSNVAAKEYHLLASITGTGPTHYGVDIPLTLDAALLQTSQGNYNPASANQATGALDIDGNASAQLTFPAGSLTTLVGTTLYFASVCFSPSALPELSSVANPVLVLP